MLEDSVFALKKKLILRRDAEMFDQLMHDQSLSPGELQSLQNTKAILHARFAMENVPFYRDLYSAVGLKIEDLDDPTVFDQLPIVEKSDVRKNFENLKSSESNRRNSVMSTTGGSTGEPLKLLRDLRTPTRTLEWRLFEWWGVKPSDNIASIVREGRSSRQVKMHDLQWWPSKRISLDAQRMDDTTIKEFLRQWEIVKPRLLVGYVGCVVEIARFLKINGIHPTPPVAVAATAAPMTEAQRFEIEDVFRAPVYDHYRSSEIPWIAGECQARQGLHVFADVRKIEIVNDMNVAVNDGQAGNIVATDLTNRVFPLIRYRLGDRSSWVLDKCDCGVTLPKISKIDGRISDAFHLPNGQIIAGEAITNNFRVSPYAVKQFQIHQHADYSIVIRCILGDAGDAMVEVDRVVTNIRNIVGESVPVKLEIVDNIAHESGKIRYIKSDVVI